MAADEDVVGFRVLERIGGLNKGLCTVVSWRDHKRTPSPSVPVEALSMTPGRVACGLALLAVFCVLGIFFFPVMDGSYSAVHGPVTALLSIRAAARLRMTIVRAGITAIRGRFGRVGVAFATLSWSALQTAAAGPNRLPADLGIVLRC